jgi:hypothetical protein
MNERIKQLALDAGIGFTLWDDSGREMIDNYTPEERLEKFAELLFNEIANTTVVSDGMFNGNERRLSVELRLGDMVKKISVFGVEE